MVLISQFLFQNLSKSVCNAYEEEYAIVLCTFIFIIIVSLYTWLVLIKRNQYQLPPGPKGLPIVGSLPFLDPEIHCYFANLAKSYGPILSLKLGKVTCVVISSPGLAHEVLKDHDVTFANREIPDASRAIEYCGHDIAFTNYGPEWQMLRKVCVHHMLGNTTLVASYNLRRREMRSTIGYLYSQKGSSVNIGEQMFLTLLNVITSMLWGDTIQVEEREQVGTEFRQLVAEVTELLGKPNLSDFFPGLAWLDLQGIRKKMAMVIPRFDNIFDKLIGQRLGIEQFGVEKDFLQVLLQLKNERDPKTPLTMHHVKALLLDMVVGGTDTTSSTVEFAMAELMNKPMLMKKAQQELDTVVGSDTIVEESHIPKLPYLHAIVKEVLRLHPALPLLIPHRPSESCVVGGYTVPEGARVFVNAWAIHRDATIWKKPLEFHPERFLNGNGDYSGKNFNYIPFGSGRRMCAGMAMAERMVMHSLASLLHSFDWELPAGENLDLSEKFGIVMKKRIPLVASPIPRLSGPAMYK
ncbi:hypothetical protein LIER_14830 [Lithospermum erythrorhizon]|uniref:Cytochrome P450 n=1 Tax=Lithospermum erythrorhizon TaxID=34254 RepID=A0AAV3Q558_LITER